MNLSPIAFFAYNRPVHTKKTLKYLKENKLAKKSLIYIFLDAPKDKKSKNKVIEVRKVINNANGFKKKIIILRKKNFGLANNFIKGIDYVVKKHGKIIVLEDDNLTSPFFLNYMNEALNLYSKNSKVASISAYSYPIDSKKKNYYFLRLADSWGWATWKRSWNLYEKNGNKLMKEIEKKNQSKEFNFENSYDFMRILRNYCLKLNNSWSIRWYASMYLKNKLTLFPPKSFIENIGMDSSGVHADNTKDYRSKLIKKYIKPQKILVKESKYHFEKMKIFFNKIDKKNNLFNRIKKKIRFIK
jgi:hypothetical protein